jgi:hypothetical protein
MARVAKVIVRAVANVTSLMSGTTCFWQHEVTDVWVSGASNAFTWSDDGTLTVTGYTTGTVLARFNLYLIYNNTSGYFPKDPENPASDTVFWDERLVSFPSIGNSIEKFETGLNRIKIGNISIRLDDEWNDLIVNSISYANQANSIYIDDVLSGQVVTSSSSMSNFTVRLNAQVLDDVLRAECNFGDPDYLNKIDITSSNAYYTGSNVPAEFQGYVIPMICGTETPYNYTLESSEDGGDSVTIPILPTARQLPAYLPDSGSVILRLIPISATEAIACRCPSWLTPISTPDSGNALFPSARERELSQFVSNSAVGTMIPGECCILEQSSDYGARLLNRGSGSNGTFILSDANTGTTSFTDIKFTNDNMHLLSKTTPGDTYTQPTLSITTLASGNKLIKVTNINGFDLTNDAVYVVFQGITGARSAPRVIEWILDSHGIGTDSTFTTVGTNLPDEVINQIGSSTNMPTVESAIGEINRSILTAVIQPADGGDFSIVEIDPSATSSQTIENEDVKSVRVRDEYRDIAKTVIFEPKYAISPNTWSDLYQEITNLNVESFYGSTKTKTVTHVLNDIPSNSRFNEIAAFWGNPNTEISFQLLDDTIDISVGDYVSLNTDSFVGKIIITSITTLEVGKNIKGRYLYDN